MEIEALLSDAAALRAQVQRRIVEQERVLEEVIIAFLAGGTRLLADRNAPIKAAAEGGEGCKLLESNEQRPGITRSETVTARTEISTNGQTLPCAAGLCKLD